MGLILVIIGLILMGISAFFEPARVSFWRLGLTLFFAGWVLFGLDPVNINTD